jgi:hypothetical protein
MFRKRYDHRMIHPKEVVLGVTLGIALIALGLIPGLFQGLAEGVRNFSDELHSLPSRWRRHNEIRQPTWLAVLGASLVAITLLAYSAS